MKAEVKNPIKRYGIHREFLVHEAGLTPDAVDRIYRALYVYSVGFYDLLKKVIKNSTKKVQVITALWKVYSILLEYCQ